MIYKFCFAFLVSSFVCSFLCSGQVLIRGTINDSLKGKVYLFTPMKGFFVGGMIKDSAFEIGLDDNKFEKLLNLKEPFQISVSAGDGGTTFLAIPGDTINLEIFVKNQASEGSKNSITIFKGANSAGHELFAKHCFPPTGMIADFDKDLQKAKWYGGLRHIEQFDSILNKQTYEFEKLYEKNKISLKYYRFVTAVIKNYLVNEYIENVVIKNEKYSFSEKIDFIKEFYREYKLSFNDPLLRNNFFSRFIGNWQLKYLQAIKDGVINHFPNKYITINGNSYFLNGNLATLQNLPKNLREGLWALKLLSLKELFAGSYGLNDVSTYKAFFPQSSFNEYLQPPFYGFFPWTKEDSVSRVKIVTAGTKDNIDSLIDKYFRGKNVIVDLWATWCVPCKQEFKFTSEIEKYTKTHNVERLYISLDMIQDKEAMIRDIYAYHLEGVHVMATYTLQRDIAKRIYNNTKGSLAIPRYFLINSAGKIVDTNFVRPSKERMFAAKISEYINPTPK